MTVHETHQRLLAITALVDPYDHTCGDNERLHAMEAHLHQDVLDAIKNNEAEDPQQMAFIAMQTREFTFTRSYG